MSNQYSLSSLYVCELKESCGYIYAYLFLKHVLFDTARLTPLSHKMRVVYKVKVYGENETYIVPCWKKHQLNYINLRGYSTPGPYFWRLCAFSQTRKQLWTNILWIMVRNIPTQKSQFDFNRDHCCVVTVNLGGVLNFELGMDVRPEVSTTTL